MPFIFVLGKGVSFSVSLEMKRLVRFRHVPVAFHKLIQLTVNATGSIKFLFLNDGIVQIKAIPGNTRNLHKAQRSDLDLNVILHLHFIRLVCSDPSLIIRFDHLCPIPSCHLVGVDFSWHCPYTLISYFRLHSELGQGGGNSISSVRG